MQCYAGAMFSNHRAAGAGSWPWIIAATWSMVVACKPTASSTTPVLPVAAAFDAPTFAAALHQGPLPPAVLADLPWVQPVAGPVDAATLRSHVDQVASLFLALQLQVNAGRFNAPALEEILKLLPVVAAAELQMSQGTCNDECLQAMHGFYLVVDQQYLSQGPFITVLQTLLGITAGQAGAQTLAVFKDLGAAIRRAGPRHLYVVAQLLKQPQQAERRRGLLRGVIRPLRDSERFDLASIAAKEVVQGIAPAALPLADTAIVGTTCYAAKQVACGDWALAQLTTNANATWDQLDANAERNMLREYKAALHVVVTTPTPSTPDAMLAVAKAEEDLGYFGAARARLTQIGQTFPSQARVWSRLAQLDASHGDDSPAHIAELMAKAQRGTGQDAGYFGFRLMQFYQAKMSTVLQPFLADPENSIGLVRDALMELRALVESWSKVEPRGLVYLGAINAVEPHLATLATTSEKLVAEMFAMIKALYDKYPNDIEITNGAGFAARFELGTPWSTAFLAAQTRLHATEPGLKLDVQTSGTMAVAALVDRNPKQVTALLTRLKTLQQTAVELAMRKELNILHELELAVRIAALRLTPSSADAAAALWREAATYYQAQATSETDPKHAPSLWNNAAVAAWAAGDQVGARAALTKLSQVDNITAKYNVAVMNNDQDGLRRIAATTASTDSEWVVIRAAARRVTKDPLPTELAGTARPGSKVRRLDGELGLVGDEAFEMGLGYSSRFGVNAPLSLTFVGWLLVDAAPIK